MAHGRFDNPVVAALAGVKDFFSKQKLEDQLSDTLRADGKTCIITGANSGLGFGIAVDMARRGARVIMAGRSQIPEAGEKVKKLSGSEKVEMIPLDLSKISSIHTFVDTLKQKGIHPDVTILNAGVALPKARKTESGQEEMFFVNYEANFILVNLMLEHELLDLNAGKMQKPRILFISSDSHRGSSHIDFNLFGKYEDYGVSQGISYYSYYKLILNTLAVELSRRLNKDKLRVPVHVICPGPVHSNIIKEAPWLLRKVLGAIFSVVFRSPEKAARPVVYMALSDAYADNTGQYLHMFNPKKMDPKVYLPEEGKKLWDHSDALWRSLDKNAIPVAKTA
jgi:NAD(P)-dependent dehydrogenase (short-subunit alcohol dehydrogenase family)